MLQDLSARLSKSMELTRLKQKLEQDLLAVQTELRDQSARFASLSAQLEKEKVDVERLEQTSLTSLFYSVLGSLDQQLEKERQELLSAQLLYQQTRRQVAFLQDEQTTLSRRLDELAGVEGEYEALLSEKEQLLRQSNQTVAAQLLEYDEQIAQLGAEATETTEAIAAGKDVMASLDDVIDALQSAEGWGTWDMLGGGLLSTAIKHSRIDDARSGVSDVQSKMSQFKRELADVQRQVDLQIDIGAFDSFADYFFDGLLFDWIVQSKISDSLARSKMARAAILDALKELDESKKSTLARQSDWRAKRDQLIQST